LHQHLQIESVRKAPEDLADVVARQGAQEFGFRFRRRSRRSCHAVAVLSETLDSKQSICQLECAEKSIDR
jgi:hypothetical protein